MTSTSLLQLYLCETVKSLLPQNMHNMHMNYCEVFFTAKQIFTAHRIYITVKRIDLVSSNLIIIVLKKSDQQASTQTRCKFWAFGYAYLVHNTVLFHNPGGYCNILTLQALDLPTRASEISLFLAKYTDTPPCQYILPGRDTGWRLPHNMSLSCLQQE